MDQCWQGGVAVEDAEKITEVGNLLKNTDLSNPNEFEKLQEKLRTVWFVMGDSEKETSVKVKK